MNTALSQKSIEEIFKSRGAIWIHNGDPKRPHAMLSDETLCSNGYFNVSKVTNDPLLTKNLAYTLTTKLKPLIEGKKVVVVGSAYAGILPSYMVALCLGAEHAYTEKGPDGEMSWSGRFEIPRGSVVIQAEDLITTSRTFMAVREAIRKKDKSVQFLPFVGTFVHRPANLPVDYSFDGERIEIVSLIEKEVWSVKQEDCPLCIAGSKRVRPKQNWRELTKKC